jgi:hypothetical protein
MVLAAIAAILWYMNSPAVEVVHAEAIPDGAVTATVSSCGGDLGVEVYEDDSLVAITAFDHRFRIRFSGGGCQDVIQVPLSVPLGGRMLIDGPTGRALVVPGS